jgi:hypothetical protein
MFFIPGIVISFVTFPGIIVHELAHQLFCRWYKVPVFKVVYFQTENPPGYVLHERVENKWHNMMISVGPFFVNTILGAAIALPAALPIFTFENGSFVDYLLIYLGVSIAMHAFPSTTDGDAIWHTLKGKDTSIWVKLWGYPVVGLIYIGSIGSFIWLDLLYGIGVAIGLPKLIIYLMSTFY